MHYNFKKQLLNLTNATNCAEIETIQSLWSGYGKISRFTLENGSHQTVVVKCISLKKMDQHPRGWNSSISHDRKVKSYAIETQWYKNWNQDCTIHCKTPDYLGSYSEGKEQWIVLEDLDAMYPLRKQEIGMQEVKECLRWLANFHATFLLQKPKGLWETGTYWHLETRPEEFQKIQNEELKRKAHKVDSLLNQCKYQTIVHGDAKLANFCFSMDSKKVAAVDFQYVGGGCGMKDVAYFLGICLSSTERMHYEKEVLDFYFTQLKMALEPSINFKDLETEWRLMYPLACTDFTRFLLGWMPTHQKVNEYNLRIMEDVLSGL